MADDDGMQQWAAQLPCEYCGALDLLALAGDDVRCRSCGWRGQMWSAERAALWALVERLAAPLPRQRPGEG